MNGSTMAPSGNEDLRYWLANEDWYMSQYTRRWLERTPPEAAANTLAAIAEGAEAEPRTGWPAVATALAASGFFPSDAIAGGKVQARKAGTRAALMLADLNDPRALAPLIRVFGQGKYQEQVEAALTRLLIGAVSHPASLPPHVAALRGLAERVWSVGDGKDLPTASAALLGAVLRALRAAGGEADLAVIRRIAAAAASARQPNRARMKQAAASLLGS